METVMLNGPHFVEGLQEEDKEQTRSQLVKLKRQWDTLLSGADSR